MMAAGVASVERRRVMLGSVAAGYLVAVSGSVALTHCVIRRVRHAPTAALSMIAATRNVSAEA